MSKFAIIETGGKQYRVSSGDKLKIEKIEGEAGFTASFDKVLLTVDGEKVQIGAPYVSGASVGAKIVRQMRDKKKIIFKYHNKTRFRKMKGHRQHMTEIEIA